MGNMIRLDDSKAIGALNNGSDQSDIAHKLALHLNGS